MAVLKRDVNAIVYCKSFTISDVNPDSPMVMPSPGRVYQAHFHNKTQELAIRVESEESICSYVLDGFAQSSEAYEFEFINIEASNIEDFNFHDEDVEIVEKFLSNSPIDPIIFKDGMIVEEETGVVSFHNDEEDEDEDDENAETDEFIEKIMKAAKEETTRIGDSAKAMNFLMQKDPVFAATVQNLLIYLASTYEIKTNIDLTWFVMESSGAFNIGSAVYNLAQYSSPSHGGNISDLNKAIQFCLFELTRKSSR